MREEVRSKLLVELSTKNWNPYRIIGFLSDLDLQAQLFNKTEKEALKAVCWAAGISEDSLKSRDRKDEIVIARDILFKYHRNKKLSLSSIGKKFNRDHATVLNGIRRIENDIKTQYPPTMDILYRINEYFGNE